MYRDYLNSDKWGALRQGAIARAKGNCEFCGGKPDAIHHIKYPQVLKYDCLDNLVVVCRSCHELSHGIRRSNKSQPLGEILECCLADIGFKKSENGDWEQLDTALDKWGREA